jgi:hypothetical protein
MAVDAGKLGMALQRQQVRPALPALPARPAPRTGRGGISRGSYIPPDQRKKSKGGDDDPDGLLDILGDAVGDIKDAAFNIPGGLVHLGKQAVITGMSIPRMGYDIAQGDLSFEDAAKVGLSALAPWQKEELGVDGLAEKYMPLTHELATSFGRTGQRLRHPTQYWRALQRGDIVDVVLEDAGNVSIAGSLVAKGLGAGASAARGAGAAGTAARLEGAAGALKRTAGIGGAINDAPVRVPVRGVQALGRRGMRLAGESEYLTGKMPQFFTEAGRMGRRVSNRANTLSMRRQNLMRRNLAGATQGTPDVSLPIEGAALALDNGIAWIDQQAGARSNLTPDDARRLYQTHDLPEQSFSPEAQALTRQYLDGTLAPEVRAQIDAVRAAVGREMDAVTARSLEGDGNLTGNGLDPRYLGDDPFDEFVVGAIEQNVPLTPQQRTAIDTARTQGLSWDDIDAALPQLGIGAILNTPEVYPTAWRPSMEAALQANAGAQLGLPVRPSEMLAAGAERPRYLPGGNSDLVNPRTKRLGKVRASPGLPGFRKKASENRRLAGTHQPYSLRALSDHLGKEINQSTWNASVREFAENNAVNRVGTVIDQQTLDMIRQDADARAAAVYPGNAAKARAMSDQLYGEAVDRTLKEQGYETYQGSLDQTQDGDFTPGAPTKFSEITEDTIILPVGVKGILDTDWVSKDLNWFLRGLETTNAFWKRNVLPFSIRWQLGDAVGGAYMAWTGGGIPPYELFSSMRKLKKMDADTLRQFKENVLDNENMVSQGLDMQERARMLGVGEQRVPRTRVGRGLDSVRGKSFGINEAINKTNRHGYVLTKLDKTLRDRGLSVESLGGDAAAWSDPVVQRAIDEAVADANRVMGTFDDLSPFEQRVLRNVFPFYVWQRHITKLAWHMAVDAPSRLVWTLRLGRYGAEHSPELPEFLKGSVQVGGALVPMNFLNPFNDVVGGNLFQNPLKSTAPAIKIGVGALTGADLNRGTLPFTRPYGTGDVNPDTGAPVNTPLFNPFTGDFRPGEFGYQILKQLPLGRTIMDVAPTGELAGVGLGPHPRYGQGTMMVDANGNPIDDNGRLRALGGLIGLPMPTSMEDAQNILTAGNRRKGVEAKKRKNVRIGL